MKYRNLDTTIHVYTNINKSVELPNRVNNNILQEKQRLSVKKLEAKVKRL